MSQKSLIIIFLLVILGVVTYSITNSDRTEQPETYTNGMTISEGVNISFEEAQRLDGLVYNKIDSTTNGIWDKEFAIQNVNQNQTAVAGYWKAKDSWDWFAWKNNSSDWQVMVSLDGWDCSELDSLPKDETTSFFLENTYQPPIESLGSEGRYCTNHSERNAN